MAEWGWANVPTVQGDPQRIWAPRVAGLLKAAVRRLAGGVAQTLAFDAAIAACGFPCAGLAVGTATAFALTFLALAEAVA